MPKRSSGPVRCHAVFLFLAVVGCGKGDVTATPVAVHPAVVSLVNMGSRGGTLELAGGSVILQVPQGALSDSVQIEASAVTSSPASNLLVSGTVYELRPTTLKFTMPVSLTVRYTADAMPSVVTEPELHLFGTDGVVWQQVAGSRSAATGSVTGQIFGLGSYGVLAAAVDAITISPPRVQLTSEQELVRFTAIARDADGNPLPRRVVSWSSSDTTHAVLKSATPFVLAITGTALITAAAEGRSASGSVEVVDGAAKPTMVEDFSTYLNTLDMLANPRGNFVYTGNAPQISLNPGTGFAGSPYSMRYAFPDGNSFPLGTGSEDGSRCSNYTIRRQLAADQNNVASYGNGIPEVWMEVYVMFSSNFTVVPPASWGCISGPEYKFLLTGAQFDRFSWEMQDARWVTGWPTNTSADTPDIPPPARDGTYHQYRMHLKVSSAPGVADGRMTYWIDRQVLIDRQNIDTGRATTGPIILFELGANINSLQNGGQTVDWGRVRIFSTDPGW
jgi:hypothetical protein